MAAADRMAGLDFLAGGGEMGALVRAFDWGATSIGPPERWPQSLRTATSICLNSRFPLLIWWGPELLHIYNDAYVPVLGDKHPASLGAPASEVWAEIWHVIGPMSEKVTRDGEPTWAYDQRLVMQRAGYEEETFFTFAYSPIPDDADGVGGVLCIVTENTGRVLGERRLRALTAVGERSGRAADPVAVGRAAVSALEVDRDDLPFALLYEMTDGVGTLVASMGVDEPPAELREVPAADGAWPLEAVAAGERVSCPVPDGLALSPFDGPPKPHEALVLPADPGGETGVTRALVLGISPWRRLDDDYRSFCELVASATGTAIADATALEQERLRAEALAELDRAKTDFFSNVSHELRTPLTLLLGPLEDELARQGQPEDAPLTLAHRNGMRLLRMVNMLLDFSRAESGRAELESVPADLSALTRELSELFRPAVDRAGLELRVDAPPLSRPVQLDPELWERIVLNLLSNALKFTFEGAIEVRVREDGDSAIVEVADSGTGIPAEELPELFTRFHRVRGARSRTHEGSGIGLALSRELVELHGGTLEAASEVDEGTTFTIRLPLAAADGTEVSPAAPTPVADAYVREALRWMDAEDDEPAAAERRARGRAGRVLLADDNADMRAYVAGLLREHFDVVAVSDGEQALAALEADSFDVVLTDVMMPRLDGLGLLAAIRANERLAALPVVMLSARAGEEAAVEALDAGADDYVVKPFTAGELRARVRSNLELARARNVEAERQREHAASMQRLYERERRVVETLQRSLLPTELSNEPYARLGGCYVPADVAPSVGGDWYDAVVLGNGTLVMAIGDVAGHGVEAAAAMGQLRSAARAYALRASGPGDVLTGLNALVGGVAAGPMVTSQVLWVDPGRTTVRIASAGHPPALLHDLARGTVRELPAAGGPPLGVVPMAAYEDVAVALPEHCRLLQYTDGLIERRGESLDKGLERLHDAVSSAPADADPEALAASLADALRPDGAGYGDDVAVLCATLGPVDPGGVSMRLTALPGNLAIARRVLRRWAPAAGATREQAEDLVLAVNESASNAVEHAYAPGGGDLDIEARRDGGTLEVRIRDRGRWRDARGNNRGRGLPMMRDLMDEVEIVERETGHEVRLRTRLRNEDGAGRA